MMTRRSLLPLLGLVAPTNPTALRTAEAEAGPTLTGGGDGQGFGFDRAGLGAPPRPSVGTATPRHGDPAAFADSRYSRAVGQPCGIDIA